MIQRGNICDEAIVISLFCNYAVQIGMMPYHVLLHVPPSAGYALDGVTRGWGGGLCGISGSPSRASRDENHPTGRHKWLTLVETRGEMSHDTTSRVVVFVSWHSHQLAAHVSGEGVDGWVVVHHRGW